MGVGWKLGYVKFSYTKNPESEFFFIKNQNLTKKIWRSGGEGVYGKRLVCMLISVSNENLVFGATVAANLRPLT